MNKKETQNNNRKKNGERKSRSLRYLGVFFISAWMFFLGVLVGRDTAPVNFDIENLQRRIGELKREALKNERNSAGGVLPENEAPPSDLGFYRALKEENLADPLDSKQAPRRKDPAETDEIRKAGSEQPEKSAGAPVAKKQENAAESNAPLKNYSVQIASTKDPDEADKLVEKFKKKGYPAYRASVELKKAGVWHRVRIGPFKAHSEAKRILGLMKKQRTGALILEH